MKKYVHSRNSHSC